MARRTVADLLVDTLAHAGVRRMYGVPDTKRVVSRGAAADALSGASAKGFRATGHAITRMFDTFPAAQ